MDIIKKIFLSLALIVIHLSIIGQSNQLKFDFTGLLKKKKDKIDSVLFGGYLIKDFELNKFTIHTDNFKFSKDSIASINIHIGNYQYILLYSKSDESKCNEQTINFKYYKKNRIFGYISDYCTSRRISVPVERVKLKR